MTQRGKPKAHEPPAEPIEAADELEAHEAPAEPWPPDGPIVVYQDKHNATAFILRANEDRTLDLIADLHGLGSPLTLFGVARRQGSGNGWEPV